jgi:CheY-like chemotaxis protein
MTIPASPSHGSATAPATVLLVDGSDDNREMYALYLLRAGYRVVGVNSVKGALAEIEKARPNVIVTDLPFPGVDGLTLCQRVRDDQARGAIPVVLLTGITLTEGGLEEAARAGATIVLSKPCAPDHLGQEIQRLIEQGSAEPLRRSTLPTLTPPGQPKARPSTAS